MKHDTQAQTEALVRLMVAARYQDASLTLSEEDAFTAAVGALAWQSGTALSIFLMSETARIRALQTDADKAAFVAEQCAAFTTPESRGAALTTLRSLIESDGVDPRESAFLSLVTAQWPG